MKVTIVDVHSNGISVQLSDGSTGCVPRKELSWSRNKSSPYRLYKKGQIIDVALSDSLDASGQPLLSVRRMTQNPWEKAKQYYQVGENVLGTVTSIFEHAVFVEFEEGVTGHVRFRDIGPSCSIHSSSSLSMGDVIRVRILGINDEHHTFECSNTQAIESAEKTPRTYPKYVNPPTPTRTNSESANRRIFDTGPLKVLLIDDDPSFCNSVKTREIVYLLIKQSWAFFLPILQGLNGRDVP